MIFNINKNPMNAENWLTQLQENGYRLTEARRAVVETVAATDRALTPIQVFDIAREQNPALGLVTVYRTLEKLEELHLIQRVHQPEGCQAFGALMLAGNQKHIGSIHVTRSTAASANRWPLRRHQAQFPRCHPRPSCAGLGHRAHRFLGGGIHGGEGPARSGVHGFAADEKRGAAAEPGADVRRHDPVARRRDGSEARDRKNQRKDAVGHR